MKEKEKRDRVSGKKMQKIRGGGLLMAKEYYQWRNEVGGGGGDEAITQRTG